VHSAISLNIARIRHAAVLTVADKVIGAVKSRALDHMFLVGGCE
jgi:hydroxylamine reductase (hybrid-cluster protein)